MKDFPLVGATASSKVVYTTEMVQAFANLSGDMNPIHIDQEYAHNSFFGKPIVHGILVTGQISALIANELPGRGSAYVAQNLSFKKPVFHNEEIECRVEVTRVRTDKALCYLSTKCFNKLGDCVIEGDAIVKIL